MDAALSELLPQHQGFLRSFVDYATYCSDAPPIYHVGVGLTTFAGLVAHKVVCPWIAGRPLVPNLYTMLVGDSQSSRKSSSLDLGGDILHAGSPQTAMPQPGSYEEMIAELRRKPHGLLTFREFGTFLQQTQRGYAAPMRTVLMDLYDWPPGRPFVRNLRKSSTVIEGPIALSMLSAISSELLFHHANSSEWFGGFFGRMLLLYGARGRGQFQFPRGAHDARGWLAGVLRQWAAHRPAPCGGFSPEAEDLLGRWAAARDEQIYEPTTPSRVRHFLAGVITLGAKVSLLYALDRGECNAGSGWLVSPESVYRAVQMLDNLYLTSVSTLAERLALSDWEQARRKVVEVLERAGDIGLPRRELLRRVKFTSGMLEEALETLREEETVEQVQMASGPGYRLRQGPEGHGGAVIPFRAAQRRTERL